MNKKTIPIMFAGGAYGTYLEWVLTTLTSDNVIEPPFENTGSSHQFAGNHLYGIYDTEWNDFVKDDQSILFARLHPKCSEEESLSDNLQRALEVVEKIIHLYTDKNSMLLVINNNYSKIWTNWIARRLLDPIFAKNLYDNWPIMTDTPADDIPIWIKREILSFNLVPSWQDEVEWYHPDTWSHERCQLVLVGDLLYNFEHTINVIQKFFKLEFKKSIREMIPYHETMLKLQLFRTQDSLCDTIINAIVTDQEFDWSDQLLPLPSQAWIQWQLRNLNYEIKCHGLDTFPTNSVQLKELLYTP
jgi:hypothetical protein